MAISDSKLSVEAVVAGTTHVNFPDVQEDLALLGEKHRGSQIRFLGPVKEEELPRLFQSADILFLPYRATGGYSAVMNLGALYGLPMIAYDLKELRECSRELGVAVTFVSPGDIQGLRVAVEAADSHGITDTPSRQDLQSRIEASRRVLSSFIVRVRPGSS
jgi:glycosyltransferase involved in cell wall biosynthesis